MIGSASNFFLTSGISKIIIVSKFFVLWLFHCFVGITVPSSICCVLAPFHIILLLLLFSVVYSLFLDCLDMLYFKLRVYRTLPLYIYELG